MQNIDYFLLNVSFYESAKKPDEKKVPGRGRANFGRIKFNSSAFANKMSVPYKTVALNELNCSCFINKYLGGLYGRIFTEVVNTDRTH